MAEFVIPVIDKIEYHVEFAKADVPCQIKIGGTGKKFVPNINASKWDDEVWLNINHPDIVGTEKESLIDGKLALLVENNLHQYFVTEDGGLEYEIEFQVRPSSDTVVFNLDFPEGLVFWYQTPLTQKDRDEGYDRPEKIEGSYAVYWNKRNNKYKTGKFCHIYRPKLIDAEGKEIWADISVVGKLLTITMDGKWLDAAKYPVRLDPELGYSTAGASNYGSNTLVRGHTDITDGSGGNTLTYHVALAAADGVNDNIKIGIVTTVDGNPGAGGTPAQDVLTQGEFSGCVVSDDNEWVAPEAYELAASTKYFIAHIPESATTKIKYDENSVEEYYTTGQTYGNELIPHNSYNAGTGKEWSTWIDYGSGAPASEWTTHTHSTIVFS